MLRKESDVDAAFAKDYSGPTLEVDGNQYVPWPQVVRILDDIVGPGNWSDEVTMTNYNHDKGIYTTVVKLMVTVADNETGEPKTRTRFGVSTQVAQASKWEREEQGLVISAMPKTHETAIDGSASLARTKASKPLGNALGLKLYKNAEELGEAPAATPRKYTKSASNGNGGGKGGWGDKPALLDVDEGGLSTKQINFGKNTYGVTDEDLKNMTRGEFKTILDTKGASRKQAATAARVGTPDDEEDYTF